MISVTHFNSDIGERLDVIEKFHNSIKVILCAQLTSLYSDIGQNHEEGKWDLISVNIDMCRPGLRRINGSIDWRRQERGSTPGV